MIFGARSNLWGWSFRSRLALTVMALMFASLLAVRSRPGRREPAISSGLVVNANTVPREVLLSLPRLGPVLAGRIVDERGRAPFRTLDDLDARVRGIGPVTAAGLRPFLCFGDDKQDPR